MTRDWYQRHVGPRGPLPSQAPTKFVIGPDGRAYPTAQEGQPPAVPQNAQQYPNGLPPWQQAPGMGQPPIGQTNVTASLAYWKGSQEANQAGDGKCPRCQSPNYFPTLTADADGGGEQGKLSAGHCFACNYRNLSGRTDGLAGPMMQMGSVRGVRPLNGGQASGDIPVELARSVPMGNRDAWGRVSGGFEVTQMVQAPG